MENPTEKKIKLFTGAGYFIGFLAVTIFFSI